MFVNCHKSRGYFWFRIFGYGIHAKRIRTDGIWADNYILFSLRGKPYWDCCGWRFRWLTQ